MTAVDRTVVFANSVENASSAFKVSGLSIELLTEKKVLADLIILR